MTRFPCPYLGAVVELTEEREQHITNYIARKLSEGVIEWKRN